MGNSKLVAGHWRRSELVDELLMRAEYWVLTCVSQCTFMFAGLGCYLGGGGGCLENLLSGAGLQNVQKNPTERKQGATNFTGLGLSWGNLGPPRSERSELKWFRNIMQR